MAYSHEYFGVGSVVKCKSFYKEYEGEVLAFDPRSKMLMLKSCPFNKKDGYANVYFVNLNMVSDVQVKKECKVNPPSLPNINTQRLNQRIAKNVAEKLQWIRSLAAGATVEGRAIFQTITKTLEEVSWQGANIVVMKKVTISPPYHPEDAVSSSDPQAQAHVRKIV